MGIDAAQTKRFQHIWGQCELSGCHVGGWRLARCSLLSSANHLVPFPSLAPCIFNDARRPPDEQQTCGECELVGVERVANRPPQTQVRQIERCASTPRAGRPALRPDQIAARNIRGRYSAARTVWSQWEDWLLEGLAKWPIVMTAAQRVTRCKWNRCSHPCSYSSGESLRCSAS